MARHPSAGRIRRQSTEPDDVFIARLLELSEWARRNVRIIVGVAVVLVLVVLGFLYYNSRRAHLDQLATNQLGQIRESIASGNVPLATKDLQTFVQRFGSTKSAPEAKLMLGQLYLQQNDSRKAITLLQGFKPEDGLFDGTRLLLLGAAYEQAGDTTQAIQTYTGVGQNASFEFQKRQGLENAARLKMQSGDPAGAARIYQTLVDMSKGNDQQRAVYELRLAEARTAAAAQQPATTGKKKGSG